MWKNCNPALDEMSTHETYEVMKKQRNNQEESNNEVCLSTKGLHH